MMFGLISESLRDRLELKQKCDLGEVKFIVCLIQEERFILLTNSSVNFQAPAIFILRKVNFKHGQKLSIS